MKAVNALHGAFQLEDVEKDAFSIDEHSSFKNDLRSELNGNFGRIATAMVTPFDQKEILIFIKQHD